MCKPLCCSATLPKQPTHSFRSTPPCARWRGPSLKPGAECKVRFLESATLQTILQRRYRGVQSAAPCHECFAPLQGIDLISISLAEGIACLEMNCTVPVYDACSGTAGSSAQGHVAPEQAIQMSNSMLADISPCLRLML